MVVKNLSINLDDSYKVFDFTQCELLPIALLVELKHDINIVPKTNLTLHLFLFFSFLFLSIFCLKF